MSDYGLENYPIDSDYIDVKEKRADVSESEEAAERDNIERESRAYQNADTDISDEEQLPPHERENIDRTHRFGRYAGSLAGSDYDEEIDQNAPQDHDGRAETRTGFNPRESPDEEKWRRLNTLNDDGRHPLRAVQNRAADRGRYVQTLCAALDMSPYHKERVQYIVDGLNMSHMAHYNSQMVVLAIISLVANEDGRWIREEEMFRNLMEDVDVTLRQLKKIRALVRRKSDRL